MALSKTHALVALMTYLENGKSLEEWGQLVPYILLPDAMRCFDFGVPNNRVLTHFEVNTKSYRPSGIKFPTKDEIAVLDSEIIARLPKVISGDYSYQVAIGDGTSIDQFLYMNHPDNTDVYAGCLIHLLQDMAYDVHIRGAIDCGSRYRNGGKFFFGGEEYDAKSVRKLISDIEEFEFRLLQECLDEEFGIVADKAFFEEYVKKAIYGAYCTKMAETTWRYINFRDDVLPEYSKSLALQGVEQMKRATKSAIIGHF